MSISEVGYVIGMTSAGLMFILRVVVIDLLKRKGLYQKAGSPRRIFFSDALPVKLLFFQDPQLTSADRIKFTALFVTWALFLLVLLLGIAAFILGV